MPPPLFIISGIVLLLVVLGFLLVVCNSRIPIFLRVAIVACGVAIGVAHAKGFKLYGNPQIYDQGSLLVSPVEVTGFLPPNLVQTTGGQFALKGIKFSEGIQHQEIFDFFVSRVTGGKSSLWMETPTADGQMICQARIQYMCGNSFHATFFPKDLPRDQRQDLSELLVDRGLAKKVE